MESDRRASQPAHFHHIELVDHGGAVGFEEKFFIDFAKRESRNVRPGEGASRETFHTAFVRARVEVCAHRSRVHDMGHVGEPEHYTSSSIPGAQMSGRARCGGLENRVRRQSVRHRYKTLAPSLHSHSPKLYWGSSFFGLVT